MPGIGQFNEKPLHASLKEWYAQPGDRIEASVDGFVIDIVHGDLLVEVQTGSFSSIRSKLMDLVKRHRVRVVFPIACEKWIVKAPETMDSRASRRKSPKRGRVEDLFLELVSFPHLLTNPNFSFEVLFTREEESRYKSGKRVFRQVGWLVEERRLLEVVDRRLFEKPADWQALLPGHPDEPFTARELAETLGIRKYLAEKMAYCLRKGEVIRRIGRRGRAYLYRLSGPCLPSDLEPDFDDTATP